MIILRSLVDNKDPELVSPVVVVRSSASGLWRINIYRQRVYKPKGDNNITEENPLSSGRDLAVQPASEWRDPVQIPILLKFGIPEH